MERITLRKQSVRYGKAYSTAREIPNSPESKESLIILLTFASSLGKRVSRKVLSQILELAPQWNIPCTKEDVIKKNKEKDKRKDLSNILMVLVDLLSSAGFFDIQNECLKSQFNKYSVDLRKASLEFTEKDIKNIELTNKDFYLQFNDSARNMTDSEKYANILYLVNQLSHIVKYLPYQRRTFINKDQAQAIVNSLRNVKDWCIHQIIEQKRMGNPIDIAIREDRSEKGKNNTVISFALPNYYEPFIVHFDKKILSKDELKLCDGKDRFSNAGIKTIFPQYINPEKMQLLEKVYNWYNRNGKYDLYIEKLAWMFDTRKILERQIEAKTSSKTKITDTSKQKSQVLMHAWIPTVMNQDISPSTHPEISGELVELNDLLIELNGLDKRREEAMKQIETLSTKLIKKLQKSGREEIKDDLPEQKEPNR